MIFSATQAVPRFVQEITDVYTKEGDVAVFECVYSGHPKPGNIMYKINIKLTTCIIFVYFFFF